MRRPDADYAPRVHLSPREWKLLFALRDRLDGVDRTLLRKLIKYVEQMEQER